MSLKGGGSRRGSPLGERQWGQRAAKALGRGHETCGHQRRGREGDRGGALVPPGDSQQP